MLFLLTPHPHSLPATMSYQMFFPKLHMYFKEIMAFKTQILQTSGGKCSLAGLLGKVLNEELGLLVPVWVLPLSFKVTLSQPSPLWSWFTHLWWGGGDSSKQRSHSRSQDASIILWLMFWCDGWQSWKSRVVSTTVGMHTHTHTHTHTRARARARSLLLSLSPKVSCTSN